MVLWKEWGEWWIIYERKTKKVELEVKLRNIRKFRRLWGWYGYGFDAVKEITKEINECVKEGISKWDG
jgi:hypothetical protein